MMTWCVIFFLLLPCATSQMACNDATEGFIPNGNDVTGLLKTCPMDFPFVQAKVKCGTKCTVDDDRYKCCRKKECSCTHGTATTAAGATDAEKCPNEGDEDCYECNQGYHISAKAGSGLQTCEANVCSCKNGEQALATGDPNTDKQCKEDNKAQCVKCNPGYTINTAKTHCFENTCKCQDGEPATYDGDTTQSLCEVNGAQDCRKCDPGYTIQAIASTTYHECIPNTCNDKDEVTKLDGDKFDTSKCQSVKTSMKCEVSCKPGYYGDSVNYQCGTDGKLVLDGSTAAKCVPGKCGQAGNQDIFSAHVASKNCDDVTLGHDCDITCANGYQQTSPAVAKGEEAKGIKLTCGTDKKFVPKTKGETLKCKEKPCDLSKVWGKNHIKRGNCDENELEHDKTCDIACDAGYRVSGQMSCTAGTLALATCKPASCAMHAFAHGKANDCPDETLPHGGSCTPKCDEGYVAQPAVTTCNLGQLLQTECKRRLVCNLEWERTCNQNRGYWIVQKMSYEDCEHWCNKKQQLVASVATIVACELNGVTSENRDSTGGWCFAHLNTCVKGSDGKLQTKNDNAAAECAPGKYGEPTTLAFAGNDLTCSMDSTTHQEPYTKGFPACNGWSALTAQQCKDKCLNDEVAPNCEKQSAGRKCIAAVHYDPNNKDLGWCHLYDKCTFSVAHTKDKPTLYKAAQPMQYVGKEICSPDGIKGHYHTPYTHTNDGKDCDGWSDLGITPQQCQGYCIANAIPVKGKCKDTVPKRKTCVAAVYYEKTSWCHLFDECTKTVTFDKDNSFLYKV